MDSCPCTEGGSRCALGPLPSCCQNSEQRLNREGKPYLISGYQPLELIYIRCPFNSMLLAGVPNLGTQTFWLGESLGCVGGRPMQEAGQHPGLCTPRTRSDSRPRCDNQKVSRHCQRPRGGGQNHPDATASGKITPTRRPQAKSPRRDGLRQSPCIRATVLQSTGDLLSSCCSVHSGGSSQTLPVAGGRPRRDCLSK